MIDFTINTFQSPDLPGVSLINLSKSYTHLLEGKIQNSSHKILWKIARVALLFFLAPFAAAIAICGMGINLSGVPFLYRHNSAQWELFKRDKLPDRLNGVEGDLTVEPFDRRNTNYKEDISEAIEFANKDIRKTYLRTGENYNSIELVMRYQYYLIANKIP